MVQMKYGNCSSPEVGLDLLDQLVLTNLAAALTGKILKTHSGFHLRHSSLPFYISPANAQFRQISKNLVLQSSIRVSSTKNHTFFVTFTLAYCG